MNRAKPLNELQPVTEYEIEFSWMVIDDKGKRVDQKEAHDKVRRKLSEMVPNALRFPMKRVKLESPSTASVKKVIADTLVKMNPTLPMGTAALSAGTGGGMTYCWSNGKCYCRWDFTLLHGGRQLVLPAGDYGQATMSIGVRDPSRRCVASSPQCPETVGYL